jgi:hypothetical protein
MSYENGLIIAFFMWLVSTVLMVVNEFSLFNRNLKKIGYRLSWLGGQPKFMTSTDVQRPVWLSVLKFLFIAGIGLAFCLLSWVYVCFSIGIFVYRKTKDSGAPESIKSYRWQMRNIDMTRDQVIRELMKIENIAPEKFEEYKEVTLTAMRNNGLNVESYRGY